MKRHTALFLTLALVLFSAPAHADLWGGRARNTNMKASATAGDAMNLPDAGTILAYVTGVANRAGIREGVVYDDWGVGNYMAATAYTLPQVPVSLDFGVTRADGVAVTLDYNVGATVPEGGDVLTGLLQYLYVGGGVEGRYTDKSEDDQTKSWQSSWVADVQLKFTY